VRCKKRYKQKQQKKKKRERKKQWSLPGVKCITSTVRYGTNTLLPCFDTLSGTKRLDERRRRRMRRDGEIDKNTQSAPIPS